MLYSVLGALAGLAIGGVGGYALGKRLRDEPMRRFWLALGGAFVFGVAVDALGLYLDAGWLAAGGAGLVAGSLTGMKYGHQRIVNFSRRAPERPGGRERRETDS